MQTEIVITRRACQARGLPAVGFAVNIEGAGLWGVTFPDARTYLSLSGPPGGPLWVRVMPLPPGGSALERLERLACVEYAGAPWPPLVFDEPGTLEIDGVQRETIFLFAGQQSAQTAVAVIASHIAADGVDLAVFAGVGGDSSWLTDYLAVASHPGICRILESFQIGDFTDPNEACGLPPVPNPEVDADVSPNASELADGPQAAAGLSVAKALQLLDELHRTMEACGLWINSLPNSSTYAAMSQAQQMAWSLQSTLPSCEQMLRTVEGQGREVEDGAVRGVMEMLLAWPDMLRDSDDAARVVEVLERAATLTVA